MFLIKIIGYLLTGVFICMIVGGLATAGVFVLKYVAGIAIGLFVVYLVLSTLCKIITSICDL